MIVAFTIGGWIVHVGAKEGHHPHTAEHETREPPTREDVHYTH